ncbi:MAG: hypothetical protein ACI9RO_000216 [Alteromonas macleodii]|jgi:hypothetical protein
MRPELVLICDGMFRKSSELYGFSVFSSLKLSSSKLYQHFFTPIIIVFLGQYLAMLWLATEVS